MRSTINLWLYKSSGTLNFI